MLDISQQEHEVAALAWLQSNLDIVACYGAPAVCHAVLRRSSHDAVGVCELVIESDERLAVGVEALHRCVYGVEREVVAALLVFGFVVDYASVNLHLASREVALEVLHVGGCVPQAPLCEREQFQRALLSGGVFQRKFLHLAPFLQRHEEEHACLDAVLTARDAGVTHAVAALVEVEWCLAGFPSWVPYGSVVVDVEVSSAVVHRHSVVAVARDAAELGVLEEGISASGVRDE